MNMPRIAGALACATVLSLLVVPPAAAIPGLPSLTQATCDSMILLPACPERPDRSAWITFSLHPGVYPVCSFNLQPAGSFIVISCVAPPGWVCERTEIGATWRIDPAVVPCAVTSQARVDHFQFRTNSICPMPCRFCGDPGSPIFSVTYLDNTGTPLTPSPSSVTFLCDWAVPVSPSTWGAIKSTYR